MKDRRAHAVTFGFDFQRNAAIVIMLENIKEMQSIRLEGNEEDIELNLENGQKILAQAKSVEQSSSDFRNVRANLKKALVTLSEGEQKTDARQLIFITNSPNPFKDNASKSVFGGLPTHRTFSNLPPSARKIIEGYLQKIEHPLNLDKFTIQVFPFETDDEIERYKAVMQCINDFIGSLNINLSNGLGKKLLTIWHDSIFINGTKKNAAIKLDKKSIIWPILVIETNIQQCDSDFFDNFEYGAYDEAFRLYGDVINSCCERVEFFTKILYDYSQFSGGRSLREKYKEFIESNWENYKEEFSSNKIDGETLEVLTKIVLYSVIRRRIAIDKIKQEVNL